MTRILTILALLGVGTFPISPQPPAKPDFNGTWKLISDASGEVFTFKHDEHTLSVVMNINDNMGKRTLEATAPIDGKPHHQKCLGQDCTLTVVWFGKSLIWDIRRDDGQMIFANRRIMTLTDRDSIHAVRTRLFPGEEQTWDEHWSRSNK